MRGSGGRPGGGQQALQFAVLEDAIRLLREGPREQPEVWQETLDWLEGRGPGHPFDFETLCAALTIDAAALRSGVLAEIAERIGPRRRPERLRIGVGSGSRLSRQRIS